MASSAGNKMMIGGLHAESIDELKILNGVVGVTHWMILDDIIEPEFFSLSGLWTPLH